MSYLVCYQGRQLDALISTRLDDDSTLHLLLFTEVTYK